MKSEDLYNFQVSIMKPAAHKNALGEYEILKKYTPGVIKVLSEYSERRQVAWLCKERLDGLNPVILTRIIKGTRSLSPFVLRKLFLAEIVSLDDLLEGRPFVDFPDEHKILLMRLRLTDSFLLKIGFHTSERPPVLILLSVHNN